MEFIILANGENVSPEEIEEPIEEPKEEPISFAPVMDDLVLETFHFYVRNDT